MRMDLTATAIIKNRLTSASGTYMAATQNWYIRVRLDAAAKCNSARAYSAI
jgi:hypothetical protein